MTTEDTSTATETAPAGGCPVLHQTPMAMGSLANQHWWPEQLNLRSLFERIRSVGDEMREIILATNPRVEGEATAVYIERLLRPMGLRVTRLATGVPVGSDLEFVDGTTLAQALEARREM